MRRPAREAADQPSRVGPPLRRAEPRERGDERRRRRSSRRSSRADRSPPPTRSGRARRGATAAPRRRRGPSPRRESRGVAARDRRGRRQQPLRRRDPAPRRARRARTSPSRTSPSPRRRRSSPGRRAPPAGRRRSRRSGPAHPGASPPRGRRTTERLGQHRAVDAEQPQQLVVPVTGREVEQHRPRRVRHVGDVRGTARQLPDEPRVDRPERKLACRELGAREDPLELRGREVRVGNEPGPLADQLRRQLGAALRRTPVLPHDRRTHRVARCPAPRRPSSRAGS